MKKTLFSIFAVTLMLTGCGTAKNDTAAPAATKAAEATKAPETKSSKKIILITPEKIGVNPFFAQEDEGVKKAGKEFGVDVKTVESTDASAIEQNLRAAVADNYDLIITSSFESEDALKKVAAENPKKSFAIIDTVVDLPNVRSVVFREHEASYLLGAAAGLATKKNVVGMVAALDIPLIKKFTVGFQEGLKSTNPNAKFIVNYVGSFTDPAKAKELALTQFSQGADFIAAASAVGDLGVFEAAKEKGFYTSGQDIDRTVTDPEHIVLSQLKGTDSVAYQTVKDFVNGTFKFGAMDYGLKEDGVGLTFVTKESKSKLSPFIGQDVVTKVKAIKDDIVAGKVTVPNPLK
ncbi:MULTISPECIES: BMP family lipoprotein [unclassified Paenibacillus]|uniref:BMP family lipoprotein n=1 Tax=unclassified Paenibacillus TaxID=185978 RepID=UPI00070BCF11|nr:MULTISPECIES: BMP family protein [unclassified Paenibacillus]KQX45767.1 ABC transporter substrate-binding protein [Paenibacillus sp. Root444D2]KRE46938.1 ABC transporter substrate-binding protein [Paenibacillus sp. Soil724D2]